MENFCKARPGNSTKIPANPGGSGRSFGKISCRFALFSASGRTFAPPTSVIVTRPGVLNPGNPFNLQIPVADYFPPTRAASRLKVTMVKPSFSRFTCKPKKNTNFGGYW